MLGIHAGVQLLELLLLLIVRDLGQLRQSGCKVKSISVSSGTGGDDGGSLSRRVDPDFDGAAGGGGGGGRTRAISVVLLLLEEVLVLLVIVVVVVVIGAAAVEEESALIKVHWSRDSGEDPQAET